MAGYARNHDVVKVGVFALFSSALFAGLFGFMTNRSLTRHHSELFLHFPAADGLKQGDAVLFHGVQVGEVKRLRFSEDGGVLVHARLNESVPLRAGATSELVAADIFGRQSVVLRQGNGRGAIENGDTLHGPAPSSLTAAIGELGDRAGRLLGDTTLTLLHGALDGVTGATTELRTLAGAAEDAIRTQQRELGAVTRAAARVADNLGAVTHPEDVARIRTSLESSTAALAHASARVDSMSGALLRIMARVESGEGTAGRLLGDPALYDRTAAALTSLEALLEDVRKNPKRYINVKVF